MASRRRPNHGPSLLLALALLTDVAASARAATFTVDSTADEDDANPGDGLCATVSGACTLRAAVRETEDPTLTPDTIVLPAGTYLLTSVSDMQIRDVVTIVGAGAETTVIDGGGLSGVLHVDVLTPGNTPWSLTLSGVTIRNGYAPTSIGGAIFAESPLVLIDSIIRDNTAFSGGGIYTTAETTIRHSIITGNHATVLGGGIEGYDLTVVDSTVTGNHSDGIGGGIFAIGELVVERSTFVGNTADGDGGGIMFEGESARITNCTLSGNGAHRHGGGLARAGVHEAGGTYTPVGSVVVQNSTITANRADLDGDGTGNGGGTSSPTPGIRLANTILAENVDGGGEAPDCSGPLESEGHDLIADLSGCALGGAMTGDLFGVSPQLGPLADNGGPTATHALLPTSPAIDAGSSTVGGTDEEACAATDQRGILRPQPSRCDIGAFEVGTDVCGAPLAGCKSASSRRSKLGLKHPPGRPDRLLWKWRGAATAAAELGDPLAGTGYVFCAFDTSGGSPRTLLSAILPGGTCPGKPCWRTSAGTVRYKNRLGAPGGITALRLKAGADDQASITAKGGGLALTLPPLPLPTNAVVLLQVRSTDAAACWEARYSTHVVDTSVEFGAASD